MAPRLCLIIPMDEIGGGGGQPGVPGVPGVPTQPIYNPPYPDHSLPPYPAHPIAPGGSPPGIWGGPGRSSAVRVAADLLSGGSGWQSARHLGTD